MPRRGAARGRVVEAAPIPDSLARLRDAARTGTYFECLGLAPDATTTEVREAYMVVVRDLDVLRPTLAADPQVAAVLDEAARVADDAFAVLSDPDLRLRYRRALQPVEDSGAPFPPEHVGGGVGLRTQSHAAAGVDSGASKRRM
jgi:curved DNA-binding protein CbpA